MFIDNKFEFSETVYLKTDPNQYPRIITRMSVTKGSITYELSSGSTTSWHYDFEISRTKDILVKNENY